MSARAHSLSEAGGARRARPRRCVHTGVLRLAAALQGEALLHPDVRAAGEARARTPRT